jgi:hypothetical protein
VRPILTMVALWALLMNSKARVLTRMYLLPPVLAKKPGGSGDLLNGRQMRKSRQGSAKFDGSLRVVPQARFSFAHCACQLAATELP